VELSLMRQNGRTLLHLINLSGHSQTGYFSPIPMTDIHVEIAGHFRSARTLRSPGEIRIQARDGYATFTVPRLRDYELVVLR